MSCQNCEVAKKTPAWRMFNPACLHCGARAIQVLGELAITSADCRERRRAVLADWMAHGHAEADLRALAAGPVALALAVVLDVAEAPKAAGAKLFKRLG